MSETHLVEHEGDHERANDTRVAVDAEIDAYKNGMEDDAGLEHDGGNTGLGQLCLDQLQLGLFARHELRVRDLNVRRTVAVAVADK